MVLRPDQQRVCTMLKDTITLLCKNGLAFQNKFCIEAVIGVTLDDQDMFHISMNEIVKSPTATNHDNSDEQSSEDDSVRKERKSRKRPRVKNERSRSECSSGDENHSNTTSPGADESSSQMADMPTPIKQPHIKGEPLDLDDDQEDDLVFVKQEMDENWSQSCSQGAMNFPDFSSSTHPQQQDQNFSSLSDMTLVPVSHNSDTNVWSPGLSPRQQQYRPRVQRTSTVTSGTGPIPQQPGDGQQPGTDQQQSSAEHQAGGFQCLWCTKVLKDSVGFRQHMDHHFGKYRYHCKLCNKGFMSGSTLRGHMSKHTGVKEFKCPFCPTELSYKWSLQTHMAKKHPEQKGLMSGSSSNPSLPLDLLNTSHDKE